MTLPSILQPYEQQIKQTATNIIRITLSEKQPALTSSKVGGNPYFLKKDTYPTGEDGTYLRLLAQINFAEVPPVLEHFPTQGILQFYIHPADDVYGLDFDNGQSQKNVRVIYHEKIEGHEENIVTNFDFLNVNDDMSSCPHDYKQAYSMVFEESVDVMSISDFRFDELHFEETMENEEAYYDFLDTYEETFSAQGHKMGGYPYFTQTDPRAYGDYEQQLILLFQLDSDDDFNIMWGDVGVGNFFISKEDLVHKRFDRVLYNWDCS